MSRTNLNYQPSADLGTASVTDQNGVRPKESRLALLKPFIPKHWGPLFKELGLTPTQIAVIIFAMPWQKNGLLEWSNSQSGAAVGVGPFAASRAKSILAKAGQITLLYSGVKGGKPDVYDVRVLLTEPVATSKQNASQPGSIYYCPTGCGDCNNCGNWLRDNN